MSSKEEKQDENKQNEMEQFMKAQADSFHGIDEMLNIYYIHHIKIKIIKNHIFKFILI